MTRNEALPIAELLEESIRQNLIASITVSGGSMAPLLQDGDLIGVVAADTKELQSGQIITFRNPSDRQQLLTHRFIAHGETFLLARGDRTLLFDPPLEAADVLGRVVWRRRGGRDLDLARGAGAWTSRRLAAVAERQRRWISGVPLASRPPRAPWVVETNQRAASKRQRLSTRAINGAARLWSQILEGITTRLSSLPSGEKGKPDKL